jgi:hypothetical protein
MINEELVSKSVEVGFRISNLTLDLILKGLDQITKGLEKNKGETPETPATKRDAADPELKQGKQTLKQLHKHNEGLSAIELTDPNLRQLHKAMKKADIDFSCVKDGKGKYTLFFKGKNADEMTSAFKRYTEKVTKIADKKAVRAELREAKAAAKALDKGRDKVKNRSKGARDI